MSRSRWVLAFGFFLFSLALQSYLQEAHQQPSEVIAFEDPIVEEPQAKALPVVKPTTQEVQEEKTSLTVTVLEPLAEGPHPTDADQTEPLDKLVVGSVVPPSLLAEEPPHRELNLFSLVQSIDQNLVFYEIGHVSGKSSFFMRFVEEGVPVVVPFVPENQLNEVIFRNGSLPYQTLPDRLAGRSLLEERSFFNLSHE